MRKFIGIFAIIAVFGLALMGCPDGSGGNNDTPPKNCDCVVKAHLGIDETCTCGGSDCDCTEQTATTATNTPIRKQAGITVEQMNQAIANISLAYGNYDGSSSDKAKIAQYITAICIVSGDQTTLNGTTLEVGADASADTIGLCIIFEVILGKDD